MEQYDSALLGILQNEGKVAPFLDTILGFLYRRTDFFRIMKTENDKLGFPPGVAYKLLANIFKKYEAQASKDATRMEEMKRAREEKETSFDKKAKEETSQPTKGARKDATSTNESKLDERGTEEPNPVLSEANETDEGKMETEKCEDRLAAEENDVKMETEKSLKDTEVEAQKQQAEKTELSSKESSSCGDKDDDEDPERARERRKLQENPLTYNGAEREAYFWSQNITETDVRVKVPKFITKGKQVKVDIQKKHICVRYQAADGTWNCPVDNNLIWEINKEESMWTLNPGDFVHINLEKREERWWACVFENEPEINTRKIDCSRSMLDLDDEAQAKIAEMMYNQRQKQLGLPQSHEQKTQEMLKKAWDAEGSPFKGQPFDPSRFNIDQSGIANIKEPM